MELTDEMKKVMDIVENTRFNVFVTGKAGTGKTTLLRHLLRNVKKNMVVTAPTGVAAINAGGATLHSTFGIPFEPFCPFDNVTMNLPQHKIDVIYSLDVLIIDEISMVRPDVLDYIDKKMQLCRRNKEPFGGAQVVMFGDMFQLPAVITGSCKTVLSQFYGGGSFFNARVFREKGFYVVELDKVFRQTDEKFISLLNHVRNYSVTEDDLDELVELRNKKDSKDFESHRIHLCTHKANAEEINHRMLGKPTNTYKADLTGSFKESSMPCDAELKLRVDARVMILVNDGVSQRYCNGTLGNVVALTDNLITVKTDEGETVKLERHKWIDYSYCLKDGKIEKTENGSCKQFPVTLAWAITIHKSQGLTFDCIALHVDKAFTPGHIYVALSRCRTLDGIVTDSYITKKHIIPNNDLIKFEEEYKKNGFTYGTMTLL